MIKVDNPVGTQKRGKKKIRKKTFKAGSDKGNNKEKTVPRKRKTTNQVMHENRRLKEKLYYLESSVSAFNSLAVNKEDRLQYELKVLSDLQKALEKKTEDIKTAFEESENYKTEAFDRIIELETECQQLKKKTIINDHQLASFKLKYNELKKWDK